MTSLKFVFYLTCLFLGKMAQMTGLELSSAVHQKRRFISANVGDSVTLRCFYGGDDSAWLFWYKQTPGQKPRLISTFYVYDVRTTFYHGFKNSPRFTLDTENGSHHLMISNLHLSDSATYYCAYSYTFVLKFAEGVIVSVKDSSFNTQPWVHQSESETIQPGGSVTLNCTVHTGTCDGEHSFYWFKNSNSQKKESNAGLIYTHGDRNDQCERKPNTQTQTCVYNLPMKNLSLSHAGTYYCAVASCGHILFGNGTKLDIEGEMDSLVLVYVLSGALTVTTILVILLALLIYKMNKTHSLKSGTESQARSLFPSTAEAEGYQDAHNLHYAALSIDLPNRSRRQRNNTKDECVYSSVRQ
ncbi:immunoglobulin kappa light chain [Lates calcarifer]|uniref:immunoglobulin kappa light chain n=1 Tax=Lates calcarifer TaxID=8187 RepID=UPI0021D7A5FD|nr:immunoglobulin kappa light chain [Lates calcarifer]